MNLVTLDEAIAHRPPMRFLDRIIAVDDKEAVAEIVVRADNPLFVPGRGLPAYAGLEMMAQTIGVVDEIRQKLQGLPPKIGFLLGCRRYRTRSAEFADGVRCAHYGADDIQRRRDVLIRVPHQ